MEDVEQTTVEEDCLDANFEEDEEDENKLWCRMCRYVAQPRTFFFLSAHPVLGRSRFKGGHTTEPPTPFINVSQEVLIKHCETVHPRGWDILKTKVAERRAMEDIPA